MGRTNRIRHIVRLSQMLKMWRKKASSSSSSSSSSRIAGGRVPADVPPGHVAVCVGATGRRFVVRATHLNHPIFRNLLRKAEEEYGFENNDGPICIPCDESVFEEALRVVTRSDDLPSRCRSTTESLPLLRGVVSDKPLC